MNSFFKIALAIFALMLMNGCESPKEGTVSVENDTSNQVTAYIRGNVIDGYISGAVVYLDLNANNYWDNNEPKVATATDGSYSFNSIVLDNKSFIPIVSVGGKDTATNRAFVGKLRSIVDTSTLSDTSASTVLVTPLTDLISTLFLESDTNTSTALSSLTYDISNAYGISLDIVNLSPMAYAGVFAKTQEIQQTKLLLETSVIKAKNTTLTSGELELLRYDIKKAIVLQINKYKYLDLSQVLNDLEIDLNITIPSNEKSFIVAQREEIKRELISFASTDNNITVQNLNDFQLTLENNLTAAYDILKNAQVTDTLSIVPLSIDVFTTTTTTETTDTNTSTDTTDTTPVAQTVALEGTVVDGYIKEATICIDTDFNGVCSYSEPSTTSLSTGEFTFSNVSIYPDSFLSIISSGGVDIATNKTLLGSFKTVLDTNNIETTQKFNITPITDLIASTFLKASVKDSSALNSAIENVAIAYRIEKEYTDKQPIEYERVFAVTQEIQQTKALIEASVIKAKGISLTSLEREELLTEINQAIIMELDGSVDIDIQNVLSNIENITHNVIADNEKDFIVSQVREIKLALDDFVQNKDLTQENLDTYQVALENEDTNIYSVLASIEGNDTIDPVVLNIDIFSVADTNVTDTTDTVDINDTTQVDTNTSEVVESNITEISFSGLLVDNYINGATVCLDIDSSGVCDSTEPFATTGADGVFSFSSIEVTKDMLIPLIGFGGVDISTSKEYYGELKSIIYTSDIPSDKILLSPLVDLGTSDYLEKSLKNNTTLMQSMIDISEAFVLTIDKVYLDPMTDKEIFVLSQKVEYLKRVLQRIVEETVLTVYTQEQTRDLQNKIKKILVSQILESGYDVLNLDRVMVALEIELQIPTIPDSYKTFAKNQIVEIDRVLDDLYIYTEVYLYTLPRVQTMLESEVGGAYTHLEYTDINMTRERVVNSMFTKVDATYDVSSCIEDGYYRNVLVDDNTSSQRAEDIDNGISINSEINATAIYYPNLDLLKSDSNIPVFFGDSDYFSFDEAWIDKNETIYIKVFNELENDYTCYRTNLDSNLASEIELVKVYRYTD